MEIHLERGGARRTGARRAPRSHLLATRDRLASRRVFVFGALCSLFLFLVSFLQIRLRYVRSLSLDCGRTSGAHLAARRSGRRRATLSLDSFRQPFLTLVGYSLCVFSLTNYYYGSWDWLRSALSFNYHWFSRSQLNNDENDMFDNGHFAVCTLTSVFSCEWS